MDRLDHLGAHHLLFAPHQVLQEEDGHGVECRQVDADVGGEEVVYLPLAAVLGRELLRGYLSILLSLSIDRLHRRVTAVHLLYQL